MKNPRPAVSFILAVVAIGSAAPAQPPSTRPTTRPRAHSAEQTLSDLLKPSPAGSARPLASATLSGAPDASSGKGAIAPDAPQLSVLREGTFLVDRTGRLRRSDEGNHVEFVFDADGRALRDPPMIVLPNLTLMAMENAASAADRDLRFRITGEVTEYRGRNYVLLQKVVVVQDAEKAF